MTLVWTDYPGLPSAASALVNDLDLIVRAGGLGGAVLLGNGGSITNETEPDRENNVEQVSMPLVPAGPLAITVSGYYVYSRAGAQPYALVATGAFTGQLIPPDQQDGDVACNVIVPSISSGPSGPTNASPVTFAFGAAGGAAVAAGVAWQCSLADPEGAVGAGGTFDWKVGTRGRTSLAVFWERQGTGGEESACTPAPCCRSGPFPAPTARFLRMLLDLRRTTPRHESTRAGVHVAHLVGRPGRRHVHVCRASHGRHRHGQQHVHAGEEAEWF